MHFDLSMQKEFDIKWKSHDISGSASLALWANMNQSTTPLGSKRQSQGKHPYPTINIFICCCVSIVCPVNIYFYVFYFSVIFFLFCAGLYFILFFYVYVLIVHFHQDGFLACSHLGRVEFVWSLCDAQIYCMSSSPWRHTLSHSVDIH